MEHKIKNTKILTDRKRRINYSISQEFTDTPGGRYIKSGPFSGELFRKTILIPLVKEHFPNFVEVCINLDHTYGLPVTFLEEAFGGLVREKIFSYQTILRMLHFEAVENPEHIQEIKMFMEDAAAHTQQEINLPICYEGTTWTDGTCCCNCKHQRKLTCHPWNKEFGKGSISETCGFVCTVDPDKREETVEFSDREHSFCEFHEYKQNKNINAS